MEKHLQLFEASDCGLEVLTGLPVEEALKKVPLNLVCDGNLEIVWAHHRQRGYFAAHLYASYILGLEAYRS